MMGPNSIEGQSFIFVRKKVLKPMACKYSIISMIYLDINAWIIWTTFKMTHRVYGIRPIDITLELELNCQ